MDLNLKDKVALVTGGSRGIGSAICRCLAAEHAKVVVNCLKNTDKAEAVAEEIRNAHGVDAVALKADLSVEKEILGMFDALTERFGRVDILINNAAYCPSGPVAGYSKEEWEYTFGVNVTGAFLASREHVRRLMETGRRGKIVNIVSQAAFLGSTSGHLPYDASKGALVSMTRALAREVAGHGININAVAPGIVKTEMVASVLEKKLESYLARIPLHRIAAPEEIARVVVFMASDAADYITGATIDVTGGMIMH